MKKLILPVLLLAIVGFTVWYFLPSNQQTDQIKDIIVEVDKGDMDVLVHATGELKAKYSEKIRGPQGLRRNRIYEANLTDIVPEGTLVTKGSYVASLDKTEVDTRMKDILAEVEKTETQLEQAKIDTAIEMRGLRDQLINLRFSLEEKELQLELNKYEPEATIRQVELEVEKIKRDAIQLQEKIKLTKDKSIARVMEIQATLRQDMNRLNRLQDLADEFTIRAPKDGMIIYHRTWNGKIGPGSRINGWNPIIAELPDLSSFVSQTYVNEVDISKIAVGQKVTVRVDAFPEKSFPAMVKQVANIGEQLRNFDAKVFEVLVELNEADSILRPAMTTQNEIVIEQFSDVLSVPIEAIYKDSVSFVYLRTGNRALRKEVITGASNDTRMIVAYGLDVGDEVYVNVPENAKDLPFEYLDPSEKERILRELASERQKREEARIALGKHVKKEDLSRDDNVSTTHFIIH